VEVVLVAADFLVAAVVAVAVVNPPGATGAITAALRAEP